MFGVMSGFLWPPKRTGGGAHCRCTGGYWEGVAQASWQHTRGQEHWCEAPPGPGFYSIPDAPGLLDKVQRVAGGWEKEEAEGRIEGIGWHFLLAVLPVPLRRKVGEQGLGNMGRRELLTLSPRPEWGWYSG